MDANGNGNGNGNGYGHYEAGYVPSELELIRDKLVKIPYHDYIMYQCKSCHILYVDMDEIGTVGFMERMTPDEIISFCMLTMTVNHMHVSRETLQEIGFTILSHGECSCCMWISEGGEKIRELQRKQNFPDCFGRSQGNCSQGEHNRDRCFMRRRCITAPNFFNYWLQRVKKLKEYGLFPYEIPFS